MLLGESFQGEGMRISFLIFLGNLTGGAAPVKFGQIGLILFWWRENF